MTERLTIRPARPEDGEMLWHWRNEPSVRKASLSPDPIPLDRHLDWYEKALSDPDRKILVAELTDQPIGMVRFDHDGDVSTVSVLLDARYRGQGLSEPVVAQAIRASGLAGGKLRAVVKPDNPASLALFRATGFTVVRDGDPMVMERNGPTE